MFVDEKDEAASTYDLLEKESGKFRESMKGAVNPMLVLQILEEGPNYVYQIGQVIEKRSGGRYSSLLYPVINKLEKIGCIVETEKQITEENRVKKIFSITDTGRTYLKQLKNEYSQMTEMIFNIINQSGE